MPGYSVYSEEERQKLEADAREPIASETLEDLDEKFRCIILMFIPIERAAFCLLACSIHLR